MGLACPNGKINLNNLDKLWEQQEAAVEAKVALVDQVTNHKLINMTTEFHVHIVEGNSQKYPHKDIYLIAKIEQKNKPWEEEEVLQEEEEVDIDAEKG